MALSDITQDELDEMIEDVTGEKPEWVHKEGGTMQQYDYVEVAGEVNGLPVTARLYMQLDDEFTLDSFVEFTKEVANKFGMQPPRPVRHPSPTEQEGSPGGSPPDTGVGCPVHGLSNKSDTMYRGSWTCKAYAPETREWTKPDPWRSKDGSQVRYYCKNTWK